jgi:uncharacterized protein YutE (UPF0331/DUF86 family)
MGTISKVTPKRISVELSMCELVILRNLCVSEYGRLKDAESYGAAEGMKDLIEYFRTMIILEEEKKEE